MQRIILDGGKSDTIEFDNVDEYSPIFAKQEGELKGMAVKEKDGWILKVGYNTGTNGHHGSLRKLLESNVGFGYEFFTNGFQGRR